MLWLSRRHSAWKERRNAGCYASGSLFDNPGHLTGVDLVIQLWPVTLRIARLVSGFRGGTLSAEAMFQFESDLQDLLRQAGRLIVQWTVNHLEPDDDLHQEMSSLFLWDGEYYRRRKKSPLRNLNCLFGPIALRRFYD